MRALAVTASNRAAAGVYEDSSGPVLVELLRSAGFEAVDGPVVVPDGEPVEAALREAVAAGYDVVVTTGGTGLTPGDLTPEMTRRVLDREVPGIAEAIRAAGAAAGVPAAICPAASPGWPGARSSSTCPVPPAGSGTAWRSCHPCSGTPSTRRTAAITSRAGAGPDASDRVGTAVMRAAAPSGRRSRDPRPLSGMSQNHMASYEPEPGED